MSLFSFFQRNPMASVTVNGSSYQGTNLVIHNGRVLVDGVDRTPGDQKTVTIQITGDVASLDVGACQEVKITGNAGAVRTASGDVQVGGSVGAGVATASGDVLVKGDIAGDVATASGDVVARTIRGKVATVSGDVNRG
jgi:hypothetical protein